LSSAETPPHPTSLRSVDLSPQAGRGEESARGRLAQHLLTPQSVAIVGQSNDASKTAGRPLKYLRQAGYAGRIYPINPRREQVLGERAWASLAALPEVPEHAYVVTPTDGAIDAVEECARLGVPIATVLANGFSEAGAEGEAREAALRKICERTGIRIVGPSSLGVVDLRHKAFLTANAAFDEPDLPVGRIFAASHSGGMIGTFLSRGKARGIGFAGLVSVGNEVDLSIGEICAATLDDPGIEGYVLFLETMRKAPALRAFALQAATRGKPILAYKLGRSAAARELAVSHTGALAGEDDIADVFLKECGIARVDTLEGLIEGFPLLARVQAQAHGTRRANVAIITTTAGGATMVVDPLARNGIAVEPPGAETLARLKAATGIDIVSARIIDLTLAGARCEVMKAALDVLTTAPEFDLIVAVIGSSARFYPDLAVKPIIDSANAPKPIAAFLVPEAPDALARLSAAGVPNFHTPEACADAVAATLKRRAPRPIEVRSHTSSGEGRMLDELEAYALLDRIGVPRMPSVAIETDIINAPSLPFPYPIAVKALSAEIAHKSDVGGVVLNVRDGAGLIAAIAQIRKSTKVDRVLVQPMAQGKGEALIGYRVDPDVGPLIMLAAGGLLAEIHRDRSLRLAPVDLAEAQAMIGEVASLKALAGYRGRPAGDLDAVARALVALSRLAVADGPAVAEAEVNPLIVRAKGQGVVAVDALVRLM
jgi:acyl-CoA synthetase (NDP forming)